MKIYIAKLISEEWKTESTSEVNAEHGYIISIYQS